jgi:hypothetical protein
MISTTFVPLAALTNSLRRAREAKAGTSTSFQPLVPDFVNNRYRNNIATPTKTRRKRSNGAQTRTRSPAS